MLIGESNSVFKKNGSKVIGALMNGGGLIIVKVEKSCCF